MILNGLNESSNYVPLPPPPIYEDYDKHMNNKKIIIGIIIFFTVGFIYLCLKAIK